MGRQAKRRGDAPSDATAENVTVPVAPPQNEWLATVGSDIRTLRKRRSMTLAQLAVSLERSVGFVSQIERGLSEPSINDLRVIAALFDVPISFFFANESLTVTDAARHVVRAGARRRLGSSEGALFEELLSPDLGGSFEIVLSEFAPGAALDEHQTRATEEAGYVVSGRFELELEGVWHRLERGDSFRFAGERYRWRNSGDVPAVLVWVISPPIY